MHGARRAVAVFRRYPVHPPFRRHLEVPVARHQPVFSRHRLLRSFRVITTPGRPALEGRSGGRNLAPRMFDLSRLLRRYAPRNDITPRIAPVRQALGNIRGTRRSRCIWPPALHRGAAVPAKSVGLPIPGTLLGRDRRNCRSRSRSAPSSPPTCHCDPRTAGPRGPFLGKQSRRGCFVAALFAMTVLILCRRPGATGSPAPLRPAAASPGSRTENRSETCLP